MSKTRWGIGAGLALAALAGALRGEESGEDWIVRDGRPYAAIVIAETPARTTRLAARELQTYIQKITGARLAITNAPDPALPTALYVGKSRHTDALGGLSVTGLLHGAYRIVSGNHWLALLGPDGDFEPVEPWRHSRGDTQRAQDEWDAITGETFCLNHLALYGYYHESLDIWEYDEAGTLNAAYDFLRELGVRWYFPGELGEIIPQKRDIPLPDVNRTVRPDFDQRELEYWKLALPEDEVLWNLRLGLNRGREVRGLTQPGHGMKFVHGRTEYKAAHPEHLAYWDGRRALDHTAYGAPCLSSRELFRNHLTYLRAMFDHFGERMISIGLVDGYSRGPCQCPMCSEGATPGRDWAGSMSDYVWGYMDRVAREIYKTHPDRMVSEGAYGAYQLPPDTIQTMSPNLAIIECRWRSSFYDPENRDRSRKLRNAWLAKLPSKEWYTRDYYIHARADGPWEGIPVYFPHLAADDLRELKGISRGERIGVYHHQGNRDFDYNEFAVQHLNLYVTTRLWWDVDQDVDAMLDEFFTLFYGPVREEMKAFITYCEANWMRMKQDGQVIDRALELLERARNAAKADSVYGQRIQLVADYVRPLHRLRRQLSRQRENVPDYRILRTGLSGRGRMAGSTFDGRLDEAWNTVSLRAGLGNVVNGAPPKHPTTFRILREGNMLYIGIRCNEPDPGSLRCPADGDDDERLLEGDYVSLLIETASHSYYELAIDPKGRLLDADHAGGKRNLAWDSGTLAATHVGNDYWSIEARLPIAGEGARELNRLAGLDGNRPSSLYPWYVNICRYRPRPQGVERTAYSPTGTNDFQVLDKFARMWGK